MTWEDFRLNLRWADLIDVFIVAVILYSAYVWLRRRAAHAMLFAVLAVAALYGAASTFNLYLTLTILQAGITLVLFALIVVFQQDIRHGFEQLSAWRPFRRETAVQKTFVDMLTEGIELLAEQRIGALIVFPGRQPLERQLRGGVELNAKVSIPLLHSLFHSKSQGHDGAIVIRSRRIAKFSVHLPLSTNLDEVGSGGTRHTAALGLAEHSDALVVAVSEERGTVTVARDGKLKVMENPAELEEQLTTFLGRKTTQPVDSPARTVAKAIGAQAACLCVAAVLWFLFAFRIDTVQRVFENVPVEYRQLPEGWVLESVEPSALQVTLKGPERAFQEVSAAQLRAAFDLKKIQEGFQELEVTDERLNLPEGVSIAHVDSPTVQLNAHRVRQVDVPIRVVTTNRPPEGLEVASIAADPPTVSITIRDAGELTLKELATAAIDLSQIDKSQSLEVKLTEPFAEPDVVTPVRTTVTVKVEVRKASEAKTNSDEDR